jgi:hypothetical protein
VWTQLLDSRPPPPAEASAGVFSVLSDTDVLERGTMYNPATARNEGYDEVWRRLRVPAGSGYMVLERVDGAYGAGAGAFSGPRAFLARLGPWALGMGRTAAGEFVAYRDEEDGGWVRKYAFGEGLPHLRELPGVGVGERVRLETGEWEVRVAGRR